MIWINVGRVDAGRMEVITRRPPLKVRILKSTTRSRSGVMLIPAMPTSARPSRTAARSSSTVATFIY
jgi:hypothetical protein